MEFLTLVTAILFGLLSSSRLITAQVVDDHAILLEIAKEFSLSSWNVNQSDFCSWPGVGCSSNQSMVERLDLSRHGLQGNVTLI